MRAAGAGAALAHSQGPCISCVTLAGRDIQQTEACGPHHLRSVLPCLARQKSQAQPQKQVAMSATRLYRSATYAA